MEPLKWESLSLALVASMPLLTSCSDDDNNGGNNNDEVGTLKGTITSDVTLKAGITYKLSDERIVETGATLNTEAGVRTMSVYDDIVDYIPIKQGVKINTMGTINAPIVTTSEEGEPGAWGGTHICGKAYTDAEGGKGSSETGSIVYDGNDDAGNSDELQYVRVEYTGYAFNEEHGAGGIMFYGMNNSTIIDHYQTYKGSDDGFEFFGGLVNVSNTTMVSCSDNSFDWTEGWSGKGTDLVTYQKSKTALDYGCNCPIEADDNENDSAADPVSHPVLKSLTLAGNGESKQGIRLRRGTQVHIGNAKVCGRGQPLAIESTLTNSVLKNGTSLLASMTTSAELTTDGNYTNVDFAAATGNKVDAALPYASSDAIKAECDWMNGNWVK